MDMTLTTLRPQYASRKGKKLLLELQYSRMYSRPSPTQRCMPSLTWGKSRTKVHASEPPLNLSPRCLTITPGFAMVMASRPARRKLWKLHTGGPAGTSFQSSVVWACTGDHVRMPSQAILSSHIPPVVLSSGSRRLALCSPCPEQ